MYFIYVCMYVCLSVYVDIGTCTSAHLPNVHMYIHAYTHTYIHTHRSLGEYKDILLGNYTHARTQQV